MCHFRRQDSSIGFGASVRANMRGNRLIDAALTSSLLETVISVSVSQLLDIPWRAVLKVFNLIELDLNSLLCVLKPWWTLLTYCVKIVK